jgi:predicted Zn-dependent peptidase
MKNIATLSFAAFLFSSAALAQPAKPAPKPAAAPSAQPVYKTLKYPPLRPVELPKIEEFTLPNGLKVKLLENHELPLVGGSMMFRTGALAEPAAKAGLAGLTGQVIRTGGTKRLNSDELNAKLEGIAASIESSIGEERGSVGFSCLKDNVDEVLGIFKQVINEPAFAQDKVDLALTQTRSGISRRNDQAGSIMNREFTNLVYGKDTPYGEREEYATIGAITRADMVAWHDRYYFPANAILAVQGDINAAEMRAKLEKLFADWTTQRPAVPPYPGVTKQDAKGVYVAEKSDSEQTFFTIGHLGGKLSDKDYPVLDVMADILGGGFSSRLFQKVRSDMSLAYSIGSYWAADYSHEGVFKITGSTNAATTGQAIAASLKEVKRMQEELVGPAELAAAKQRVENSFVFNFDSPSKALNRLMSYEFFGYPRDFINQYKDAVAKVTAQDIQRVAQQYIKPSEFTIVAVGKTAEFEKSLASMGPVKKLDISIPEPKQQTAKADSASLAKGQEVLSKLVSAAGGAAKIEAVNDWTQSLESELPMGPNKIKVKQVNMWIRPSLFRQTNELPFGKTIIFFDGEKGFLKGPQGEQPLPPPFAMQVRSQLSRDYFSLLTSAKRPGRTVNFVKEGQLEIADPGGAAIQLGYDPATMLISKVTVTENGMTGEYTMSDFKEFDGIQIPTKTVINQAGQTVTQIVTDYKLNSGLKPEQLSAKE